jgi:hypothetical protein
MFRFASSALIGLVTCGVPLAPGARAQDVTGGIEGWIVDARGSPLPDVVVTALRPRTTQLGITTSNAKGFYRLSLLPVGTYTIAFRRVGYRPVSIQGVAVRLGTTGSLGVTRLEAGAVELPEVIAFAERPLMDPTTTASGGVLHEELYETLPVERNFHALPALLPQANSSYFGDEVNIAGSSGPENVYYVDGVNVTDPYRASSSGDLPYNFIREVVVKTGGYEAEYGRALGGIVNVITHSGGNDFQGEGFGFFTSSDLSGDWRRGLTDANVEASADYDAGASLGGPIVRGRAWFFAAYSRSVKSQDIRIPTFATQRDSRKAHLFAAKIDWQPAGATSFALTVLGDPSTRQLVGPAYTPTGYPTGLDNIDPFLGELRQGGFAVSARGSHRAGTRLLLESLVSRFERDEIQHGATERARREPVVMDLETGRWSGGFGDNSDHHSVRSAAKVSGVLSLGAHALKAGVEYEDNRLDAKIHFTDPGIVTRLNDTTYHAVYVITDATVHNRVASLYLQDSWLLSPHLRLNAGLRWDGQYLVGADGRVAQPITDGFQPRIGLILLPGRSESKVAISYGRFYEQLPTFASGTWWHVPVRNGVYFFDRDPRDGATPLDSLDGASHGILPEVPGLRGQHFDELTVGYEGTPWARVRIGVRGVYRTLREVIDDGLAPGTGERILGNPGRGRLDFLPHLWRTYHALEFTFDWRGTALTLAGSYVLSRNRGNVTGLYDHDVAYELPNGKTAPDLVEQVPNSSGLLPNDRPHLFKLFGSCRLGSGLTLGSFFTWQSGTPLSEFGATFLPAHFTFLRPRGTIGRTPTLRNLDLRLTYGVPGAPRSPVNARVILDVLHAASGRQAVTMDQIRYAALDSQGNQSAPNPNYLKPTRHQPPMTLRVGAEVEF